MLFRGRRLVGIQMPVSFLDNFVLVLVYSRSCTCRSQTLTHILERTVDEH